MAAASAVTVAAADAVTVAASAPTPRAGLAAASAVTVAASADIHCFDQSYFVAVALILGRMLLTI